MKKIIGYDPVQKKTTYFHGGNDGQHHVSVEQDTKDIIKKAKDLKNIEVGNSYFFDFWSDSHYWGGYN